MLSKGEGGGAYLTFVNISNINIGDNIENNIGDNVGDIGVLSAGEGGGGEGRCRLAPLAGYASTAFDHSAVLLIDLIQV